MARATLAPSAGMVAPVPALRKRPLATMKDMGMGDMSGMGHDMPAASAPCPPEHAEMGHCKPAAASGDMPGMSHNGATMSHSMRDFANAPALPRTPTVQTVSPMPMDRTGEPPQGLADIGQEAGYKVLVYRDLVALDRNPDLRAPSRQMRIHLTGNMERYMWAFDGVKLNEVKAPIPFRQGERVRVTLVNDTMMAHPIHLHGHFFELVTGHGDHAPRKHTINVAPGGTATFDLTADAVGLGAAAADHDARTRGVDVHAHAVTGALDLHLGDAGALHAGGHQLADLDVLLEEVSVALALLVGVREPVRDVVGGDAEAEPVGVDLLAHCQFPPFSSLDATTTVTWLVRLLMRYARP